MKETLVVQGDDYKALVDLLERLSSGEDCNLDDCDFIGGLMERWLCCYDCEDRHNEYNLEKVGIEKKGGVYVQA